MKTLRYRWPAMLLHWFSAALILGLLWLGWQMVDLPKGAERSAAYGLHKSLGLLSLLLLALRLAALLTAAARLEGGPRHGWPPPPISAFTSSCSRRLWPASSPRPSPNTRSVLSATAAAPAFEPDEQLNALFKSLRLALV
jgi:hypothetical protein